jgi:hypothetical protein
VRVAELECADDFGGGVEFKLMQLVEVRPERGGVLNADAWVGEVPRDSTDELLASLLLAGGWNMGGCR